MDEKFGKDLTIGSIPRHLLLFSIPMLLGNAMQIGYGIVNTIWVGHLVGENAVGAIGVSFPVIYVVVGISMGMSIATTILVAQFYGAKDYPMVERAVGNSFSLTLIVGAVMTIAGILSSDALLRLMGTPPKNFAMASTYLENKPCGHGPLISRPSHKFHSQGHRRYGYPHGIYGHRVGTERAPRPLPDRRLRAVPSLGLKGAACATLLSQAASLGTSIFYLNRRRHVISFRPSKLSLDGHMTFLLFKIGLPSIVQQSLVSIGSLVVTTFVNSFGSAATNVFGAVGRIDMIVFMPALSMSLAVSALTGQNLGAGRPGRVKEVFKWGVVMTSSITLFISLVVVILSRLILRMFGLGDDGRVMDIGVAYLRIVGSCYIFFAIMFISNGVINGAGHTMITMAFTLLSLGWCGCLWHGCLRAPAWGSRGYGWP